MKRYLLLTATLTLGFCLLVGLFNYRVDPYAIYHFKQANSRWLSRIDQFYHMRVSKPWQVFQTKPTAIVLGTSRTGTVPPQHPAWSENRGYNLSVPGMTVYEMLRFIEHAQAVQPLDKLMIGLDFEAFILPEPYTREGFEEDRMARTPDDFAAPRFAWQFLKDIRDTLFSTSGLTHSVSALAGTARVGRRYLTDGTWESTTSTLTGTGGFIYIGKSTIFELRNEQLDFDRNIAIFADVLRFAHQHKIDTRLFVTPEHIFMIDLWWRLGYGDLWGEFHRRLIAVNDDVAREMGVAPFPLFGFNQLEGVVDEPIRRARAAARSLFSDGAHFRLPLGQQIMTGAWGESDGPGMRLDTDSVATYLERVDYVRQSFVSANPKSTASLRRAVSRTLE